MQDWESTGQYTTVKEYSIFYKSQGTKTPLLLLHGFPTSSWDWHKIWDELAKDFMVIAPDFLGYGFSDKPIRKYSIALQADLVESILQEQKIKEYHILAHDYGDTVAQELIAKSCQENATTGKILSVTFLNGGLFPETHKPKLIQKLMISPLGRFMVPLMSQKTLDKNMRSIFGPDSQPMPSELETFWKLINHKNGKPAMIKLIGYIKERVQFRSRWVKAMQETSIPLKLINGAFDPISGKHMAERYTELIPNADISSLPNIGHYPQVEAPEEVTHYFKEFILSLSA